MNKAKISEIRRNQRDWSKQQAQRSETGQTRAWADSPHESRFPRTMTQYATALYNYAARYNDELSLFENEVRHLSFFFAVLTACSAWRF